MEIFGTHTIYNTYTQVRVTHGEIFHEPKVVKGYVMYSVCS